MTSGDKKNWIQKITFQSIKQTLSTPLQNLTHFLSFPKRVYDKHPRLVFTLALTTLFVGGGLTYAISKQQAALYFPEMGFGRKNEFNPRRLRHPSTRELQSDDLEILTQDGVTLRGWQIKKQGSQRIIVYFHGNAGNIGTRLPFAESLMTQTNSDVIMVGYRGYSDSDGTPTQKGLQKDAQAILNEALKIAQRSGKRLYVFGTSLGGAATIYVSGLPSIRQKISGVIVQNTFTSTTDVIPSLSPVLRIFVPVLRLFNRNSWDSLSRINQLRRPIMFIKCGMDEIIPSYMTDKLREECNKYHIHNYLYELPNGRHNEVHIADPITYFNQLNEFFSATL